MVIGIDVSRAFLSKRTGIEEYSYQLIKHLRNELAGERVVLYVRKRETEDSPPAGGWKIGDGIEENEGVENGTMSNNGYADFELPNTWEVKELWGPRLWTQGRLALEMFLHPVDVLLVPAHTVPWIHPKNTVVVVHGLEYEFCPEAYSWWERVYMRWSIRNSCRWASSIIAVSENTKKDLVALYGVPEEKIAVVYEGVGGRELGMRNKESGMDSKFQIQNFKLQINFKYQVSRPYFLFIGRIEARKNVARMIEAFDIFKKKCGTDHQLVLAGKPGYGYENNIKYQLSKSKYLKDIMETGYVSEEEKWQLLSGAGGFLFPTLYEGFGLPVLEAQSAGVPVLTSNVSSLPEVAGDSAILVDPRSVDDIARGIEKIALDSDFRSGIIENGRKNVKRFSWEKCAKEVAEVLFNG